MHLGLVVGLAEASLTSSLLGAGLEFRSPQPLWLGAASYLVSPGTALSVVMSFSWDTEAGVRQSFLH